MRIYIRHADKLYANGRSDTYKHDPGIIPSEECKIRSLACKLISKYGLPTMIVSSPYLRTRQTAQCLHNVIASMYGRLTPMYCDVTIAEYLGNHPTDPLDVTPDTQYYNPPHPETIYDLKNRVTSHDKNVKVISENTWFITHGIVIKTLGRLYKSNYKHIDPLGAFYLSRAKLCPILT